MKSDGFVPERFRRAVVLHVTKNLFSDASFQMPLILGIHGPSGDGKTYQCEHVLNEMGVKPFLISGGQLESGTAGDPAKLVRDTYWGAGQSISKGECSAGAIIVNDVDTGLGDWGAKVQTTINTQTVYGELMHIVDFPTSVEGRATRRVPFILTGNDFTKLYEPLVRASRMTAFEWRPSVEEKANVVAAIFPELQPAESISLVREFQAESVAFFSSLRATLVDETLWTEIQQIGVSKIVSHMRTTQPKIRLVIKLEQLIAAARLLLSSGQLINHLGRHSR